MKLIIINKTIMTNNSQYRESISHSKYIESQSLRIQSNNKSTRRSSLSKHIPIFSNRKININANSIIFKESLTQHIPIFKTRNNYSQVIAYDFCGCENKITPCDIIQQTFLTNASLKDIKDSYMEEAKRITNSLSMLMNNSYRKALFRILPLQYPQIFQTHLNNLIQVIGLETITPSEFQCLYSIQYHTKYEYLTYYLYKDLKKSFLNMKKFKEELEVQFMKFNTSVFQIRYLYNDKLLADRLDRFINEYFESVGANLIPLTRYAKFISMLFKKGPMMLIRFLANFIVNKREQLEHGLKLLKFGQLQQYNHFMRELNFEKFIENIQ